ncbi:MAG: outer membrane lipoprotein-sorting protein, partial [Ectothiorhodospiraceae bacterium AqS1]|nr:outer membrane lipoprotein-sorting protein [Ectothiorhodospiraceae bacterium AqS1]
MTRSKPSSKISRRQAIVLLGGATATLAGFSSNDSRADGQDILRAADRYRAPEDAFVFDARISDPEKRTVELTVRVRDRTKGLALYNAPASFAGRAILYVGRNMWVYVPGTRRALRISPQQQVLGAVASADVARTVFAEDYEVIDMSQSGERVILDLHGDGRSSAYGRISLSVDRH